MNLMITEKQLKDILGKTAINQELSEAGEGEGAPEAGTSSDGEKKTNATKWETGIKRGPGNPLGVGKWSETEGTQPVRGKANPLSEEDLIEQGLTQNTLQVAAAANQLLNPTTDTPTKTYKTYWGKDWQIPTDGSVKVQLWNDDKPRAKSFHGAFEENGYYFWPQTYINPKTKKPEVKDELAPSEEWLNTTFPTGTIKYIEAGITPTNPNGKFYGAVLNRTNKDKGWVVTNGYFYNPGSGHYVAYDPEQFIHTSVTTKTIKWTKENWAIIGEVAVSVLAGILTGGSSLLIQALVQSGVSMAFAGAVYATSEKTNTDKTGLAVGILISALPFIPAATKLGLRGPLKGLAKYGEELAAAEGEQAMLSVIAKFSKEEQQMIARCFKEIPKYEFEKIIKDKAVIGFAQEVRAGKIALEKIPAGQLRWWKEAFVEVGGALPIVGAGFAYNSIEQRKADEAALLRIIKNNEIKQAESQTQKEPAKVLPNPWAN